MNKQLYLDGLKYRSSYGILVYCGNGWRPGALRFLKEHPQIAVPFSELDDFLFRYELWDQSIIDHQGTELEHSFDLTPPRRSNENGKNAKKLVSNHFAKNGFATLEEIHLGRDVFRNPYKWDVVAFTDTICIYAEVKNNQAIGGGTMEDKLVKSITSIQSINLQHFDCLMERLAGRHSNQRSGSVH